MFPIFWQLVLHILFGQITVENVPEPDDLDLTFIFFDPVSLNIEKSLLKIDQKVPLRINGGLKELDLLDEFPKVTLHPILGELAATCVGSVPGP